MLTAADHIIAAVVELVVLRCAGRPIGGQAFDSIARAATVAVAVQAPLSGRDVVGAVMASARIQALRAEICGGGGMRLAA